jgi:hypothetical protein
VFSVSKPGGRTSRRRLRTGTGPLVMNWLRLTTAVSDDTIACGGLDLPVVMGPSRGS